MRHLRSAIDAVRARPGPAAILSLGVAWALIVHSLAWAQTAHFAQVRAFAAGQPEIDRWHWETGDKAWVDGHFYSVKAPGVAALSLPLYFAIDASGADTLARNVTRDALAAGNLRLTPRQGFDPADYGGDAQRAKETEDRVIEETPVVWALTLLAAVIPSLLLLHALRWVADRIVPG